MKESCGLIETLSKPHTPSLDEKMPLLITLLLFCCQIFYSDIILTFSLKHRNHNTDLEKKSYSEYLKVCARKWDNDLQASQ